MGKDKPGDFEMVACVDAWLAERKIDKPTYEQFATAVKAVFKSNPSAAERYKTEVLAKIGLGAR